MLVGFCAANAPCFAQEEENPFFETAEAVAARQASDPDDYQRIYQDFRFDIMFSQPTSVEDFADLLREKTDGRVNILVASDARNVMISSLELKGVSIASALLAMSVATRQEVYYDDSGEGFIQVMRDSEISLKVFNVSHIVSRNEQAQTSMLSAIEIGLKLNNSSPENVSLKFHEETKLLFIRASDSDLDIVIQVLEQLGGKSLSNAKVKMNLVDMVVDKLNLCSFISTIPIPQSVLHSRPKR